MKIEIENLAKEIHIGSPDAYKDVNKINSVLKHYNKSGYRLHSIIQNDKNSIILIFDREF